MRKHPSTEELQTLGADLGQRGHEETHRHLLLCRECRKRAFAPAVLDFYEPGNPQADLPEERVLTRVLGRIHDRLGGAWPERGRADSLVEELAGYPAGQQLSVLATDPRFWRPAVAYRLLDTAEACAPSEPAKADHLAALALIVAQRLPFPWTGLERESLLGRSRLVEGEAWRVRGELDRAEKALASALRHLELIPSGSPERASLCQYLSRLRRDQGRDDEALALVARAVGLFEALPEPRRVAECRLEWGWLLVGEMEPSEALLEFEEAVAFWETPDDFEPWLSARHGLAVCHADLRSLARARSLVAGLVQAAAQRSRLDRLRVARVEANVAQALDFGEVAMLRLSETWPGLLEEGEAALGLIAALDLASLYAEENQPESIQRLARQVERTPGLPEPLRDVALFVLSFLFRHGYSGLEVLEEGKAFLGRASYNPELRFSLLVEPGGEVQWATAELAFRRELVAKAGLRDDLAQAAEGELSSAQRNGLSWTAEATLGVRLRFVEPAEPEMGEHVH